MNKTGRDSYQTRGNLPSSTKNLFLSDNKKDNLFQFKFIILNPSLTFSIIWNIMNYFTPIKDSNLVNKIHKTTTQTREGDWICLNCNNLNFSFRKKCNRCKTQTREQNDITETYDYYYYPAKNYLYVPNSNTLKNSHHTATSDSKDLPLCHTPIFTQNNK